MAVLRLTALGALVACAGCLDTPSPSDIDGGGNPTIDASTIDASTVDADPLAPDGNETVNIDASNNLDAGPPVGEAFPPVATDVSINGGWAGDINGDGIDDVLLLSDTFDAASAGVYVLYGQSGTGLPDYHQFLATGTEDPRAVIATQLDGTGALDIVLYAVKFDGVNPGDSLAYMRAYLANGATFVDPPVENHITAIQVDEWKPRTRGTKVDMTAARFDMDDTAPGFAVVHERGGFTFEIGSWNAFNWQQAAPVQLVLQGHSGVGAVPNETNPVDDLILWSGQMPDGSWQVNDGHGTFTPITIEGAITGPMEGALVDLDGVPPLDIAGYRETGLLALPVDDDTNTAGAYLDGIGYVPNMGAWFTEIIALDTNVAQPDTRPEIIAAAPDCDTGGTDPCLLMIRNAYLDQQSGALLTDQAWARFPLPAGAEPRAVLYGDFDGDDTNEVIVFDQDGTHVCTHIDDATFAPCE